MTLVTLVIGCLGISGFWFGLSLIGTTETTISKAIGDRFRPQKLLFLLFSLIALYNLYSVIRSYLEYQTISSNSYGIPKSFQPLQISYCNVGKDETLNRTITSYTYHNENDAGATKCDYKSQSNMTTKSIQQMKVQWLIRYLPCTTFQLGTLQNFEFYKSDPLLSIEYENILVKPNQTGLLYAMHDYSIYDMTFDKYSQLTFPTDIRIKINRAISLPHPFKTNCTSHFISYNDCIVSRYKKRFGTVDFGSENNPINVSKVLTEAGKYSDIAQECSQYNRSVLKCDDFHVSWIALIKRIIKPQISSFFIDEYSTNQMEPKISFLVLIITISGCIEVWLGINIYVILNFATEISSKYNGIFKNCCRNNLTTKTGIAGDEMDDWPEDMWIVVDYKNNR